MIDNFSYIYAAGGEKCDKQNNLRIEQIAINKIFEIVLPILK